MNARSWIALTCLLAWAAPAHRLDDLLQTVRIGVEREQVELSLRLTPGSSIAGDLLPLIDLDSDGRIAPDEARAYAMRVLGDLDLTLDQAPLALHLKDVEFPEPSVLRTGVGVVRINARASIAGSGVGRHVLGLTNDHLPGFSVHLVNALKPVTDEVRILKQSRSRNQRSYELEFVIEDATEDPSSPPVSTATGPTS